MILPYVGATLLIWIQSIFVKKQVFSKISSISIVVIFVLFSTLVEYTPVLQSLPGGINLLSIILIMYIVKSEKYFDLPLFLLLVVSILKIEIFWCLSALLAHFCYRDNKNSLLMFIVLVMFLGELIISAAEIQSNILVIALAFIMLLRNLMTLKDKNWDNPSNFVICSIYGIFLFKYAQIWDLGLTSIFSIIFILYILFTSFIFKEFNSNSTLVFVVVHYLNSQSLVLLFLIPLIIFLQRTTPKNSLLLIKRYLEEINIIMMTLVFLAMLEALSYFELDVVEGILLLPLLFLIIKAFLSNKLQFNSIGLDKIVALLSLIATLGIMYI